MLNLRAGSWGTAILERNVQPVLASAPTRQQALRGPAVKPGASWVSAVVPGSMPAPDLLQQAQQRGALRQILLILAAAGYRFTATTPLTHQRVLAHRASKPATSLRDVFGWSLPFAPGVLMPDLLAALDAAGLLQKCGALLRSAVRVASLDNGVYLHSAYPTMDRNAVFFGPDTYRFVRFIQQNLHIHPSHISVAQPLRILDIGCGSGAGGLAAARYCSNSGLPVALTLCDINPLALQWASINSAAAALEDTSVELLAGDARVCLQGEFDWIVCNPPYLDDAAQRAYRHGGQRLGRELSVQLTQAALARLAPGGHLLLYSGVAMEAGGVDPLRAELLPLVAAAGCEAIYSEIDPDVFGEELERPVYAQIERIAAIGLVANRPAC
jgi:methylase of polypeptide subunit release factors